MGAALALAERGRGRTAPNPNVGCVIVADGRVVGRGWTQAGGRPHAEAMALAEAGAKARGATAYVTLEPCAHQSPRGPACSDLLIESGVARVVAALEDPDVRTAGLGFARLGAAGIAVTRGTRAEEARRSMAGFLTRQALGRPHVTLKLATSLDGCIAMADGSSRWITGAEARAHAHLERSRHEAILVGRGTYEADAPRLDVRLPGLEARSPKRVLLSANLTVPPAPSPSPRHSSESWNIPVASHDGASRGDPSFRWRDGIGAGDEITAADKMIAERGVTADGHASWTIISSPQAIITLPDIDHILVEGGAAVASAFLAADLVDRLILYRAPILIGGGKPALRDIGLTDLADTHQRWTHVDARQLGSDRLEVYERERNEA
ncbi:bifunctional diaminohydroxyphosphoribosylaminopyrimidine deaminase/5-amino-6-(5-phosphoribosylamino)uracil reductase RibD [Sphingomonas faeni]|uniref:bifunctional diaminohydroxyphosphoribosylaminopyrimidine deaminase/5-amino-6-(5-phosphoribosylamino)uracil reductase RibD n=1 Tax=Sphingomonas faeni TaxID=185950 RepID=UPI0020C806E7|nr:bifunctional diaminohydroxyphosphoribosylaminopyrimidine deaminase/5-amino-6-(5-phosphoribosylamino)uracil reductase RibD [Sphingomonas faeni]MCP8892708.1 bifunctional diaminohydroxyphosphoribosylaminopyrimidine deaminase/5-amino-6-(5-phosphoribosylamino)uracil reductase RibD [Sphingomonas faeni]